MAFANGFCSHEVGLLVGLGQEDPKGRKKGDGSLGAAERLGCE